MRRNKKNKTEQLPDYSPENFGTLNVNYTPYKTILTNKYINRKHYTGVNNNLIVSNIPGTIKKINVSIDDVVKKGDVVCIIDSMKMNNNIISAHDGKVIYIFVKHGEVINKGAKLFELELTDKHEDEYKDEEEMDYLDSLYVKEENNTYSPSAEDSYAEEDEEDENDTK